MASASNFAAAIVVTATQDIILYSLHDILQKFVVFVPFSYACLTYILPLDKTLDM